MDKAVLISIRPEWVNKIIAGEKTVEIRKTRPKLKTPFKCYIYMTRQSRPWRKNENGCRYDGRVVAEFTCDRINCLVHVGYTGSWEKPVLRAYKSGSITGLSADFYVSASCLSVEQIEQYLAGGDGYAWHISDMQIYDRPKKLDEFTGLKATRFGLELYQIERAPQSWCYVEEQK